MSYILDALRRADAERERGAIPSIHAQPASLASADSDEEYGARARMPWKWAGVISGLALLLVLAWYLVPGEDPPMPVAPVTTSPDPMLSAAPAAPVVPAADPEPPRPLPVQPPPAPPVPVARKPAASTGVPRPLSGRPSSPAPTVAAPPVRSVEELPDQLRRELPQLSIGGAMYSKHPASRMLIVNGQVFHEGDKVSDNLVLEEIRLKSAVLAYKGHRYSVSY